MRKEKCLRSVRKKNVILVSHSVEFNAVFLFYTNFNFKLISMDSNLVRLCATNFQLEKRQTYSIRYFEPDQEYLIHTKTHYTISVKLFVYNVEYHQNCARVCNCTFPAVKKDHHRQNQSYFCYTPMCFYLMIFFLPSSSFLLFVTRLSIFCMFLVVFRSFYLH